MNRSQRKFELLKGTYNTLLVAILGSVGYIFVNFYTLDNTRIIIGSLVCFTLIIVLIVLLVKALEE
ncbi:MAG: hypothetical protein MSA33_02700 [Campylobacter sp.]|uniref:hypothetical protein n=1 Tax=Campylobacter sp. TaxID=205 RepID=UPI002AA673C8|nr:hypothetical protein [Campylobacter sp.]MCI7549347.1 hypothetical protein [Campylobacter sp.]